MIRTNTTKQTSEDTNPVKQVVDVMKKVDTDSPDAKRNEVSILDVEGNPINLNDEDVRFNYFLGRFVKDKKTKK